MKVSIAMASFNGERYIKQQLDSFLLQTRLPDELIITDDCSTDRTKDIVDAFAASAPFPVFFYSNKKNLGYCGNFNAALSRATGDLVFLSDQDDVWFPNKIEFMVALAEENPDMLVLMNNVLLTDGDLNSVGLTKLGQFRSAGISLDSYVLGCCCVIRRKLLDVCIPIPEGYKAHDNWIVDFAHGLNAKLVNSTCLQYYRRHGSNESQFVASKIVKINKIDVFINGLRYLFSNDRKLVELDKLSQMSMFSRGLEKASFRESDLTRQIEQFKQRHDLKVELYRKRVNIRSEIFPLRFYSAVKLFLRGGYQVSGGFKSFIRDIIG
tara:strand:- start:7479 stop:8447 length:969 start_codon:yes stop_codon:yes gene_type:complete